MAVGQALVAAVGWFAEPLVAGRRGRRRSSLLGGIAAVSVIGPARSDLGLARYAMPSIAGIAATLFGRLIPGGLSLLLVPIVAVLLWSMTYLELRIERGTGGRTIGDLLLTAIVFTARRGCSTCSARGRGPRRSCSSPAWRCPWRSASAEAREHDGRGGRRPGPPPPPGRRSGRGGGVLLNLTTVVMAALMALGFYTWAGAVDTLRGGASGRAVAAEFGSLLVLGLVVGLLACALRGGDGAALTPPMAGGTRGRPRPARPF